MICYVQERETNSPKNKELEQKKDIRMVSRLQGSVYLIGLDPKSLKDRNYLEFFKNSNVLANLLIQATKQLVCINGF